MKNDWPLDTNPPSPFVCRLYFAARAHKLPANQFSGEPPNGSESAK